MSFLMMTSYARVEIVPGQIALDRGVATILPSRSGIVTSVEVAEGQHVDVGQRLAVVRAEENLLYGSTAPERIYGAIETQTAHLIELERLVLDAARAKQSQLEAQIDGDAAAVDSLKSQVKDQERLVATAINDFNAVEELTRRGFVSQRDQEQREATLLSRRQHLSQLEQLLSDRRSGIEQGHRAIAHSNVEAQAQIARAQSERATLIQRRVEVELSRGYVLESPVSGIVTALTARAGQPASSDQQLMLVVPTGSKTLVELYVPSSATGFIDVGQDVRVAIDAFPYQTFGTVHANVVSISRAAVLRQGSTGPHPIYLVTAALTEPWVTAFGRQQPLFSGMTLTARIVTERRSLIEWLFEPIFAVRNR